MRTKDLTVHYMDGHGETAQIQPDDFHTDGPDGMATFLYLGPQGTPAQTQHIPLERVVKVVDTKEVGE